MTVDDETPQTTEDPDRETRLRALGDLVEAAAQADMTLRTVFCALVSNAYSVVVAAGQQTRWLIDTIDALIKARRDIRDVTRAESSIRHLREANDQRNKLIHNVWAAPPGEHTQLRTGRFNWQMTVVTTTVEGIAATSRALRDESNALSDWITDMLGFEALGIEAELRWREHLDTMPPEERERLARQRRTALGIPETDDGRIWLPIETAQVALADLIDETTTSHIRIVIASDAKPHVALLPLEDLAALEHS